VASLLLVSMPVVSEAGQRDVDVLVYEASSGGVGAAVAAARAGKQVLLVEPTQRVGGMMTNGVTTDIRSRNAATGLFDEYRQLVHTEYRQRGEGSNPLIRSGLYAAPEVSLRAVNRLLDHPNITVLTETHLTGVETVGDEVTAAHLSDGTTRSARVFVDASPVGDLLGTAGRRDRDWVVGREGRSAYDEVNAPEQGDDLQQAYTYRATFQVGGRTDYAVPATYAEDLERYRSVNTDRELEQHVCTVDDREYFGFRIQRCLPDGKMDINIDLIGFNHAYPTDPATRAGTEARLRDFLVGYLHYLRTERELPELGLSVDDYPENGGFPVVLYVREGRRAVGEYVFTESDAIRGKVTFKPTSVAIGDYGLDSHSVAPFGAVTTGFPGNIGGFWAASDPYQVPFEVMLPRRLERLLVPVPVSASHVGYSTLRMEPVRMNLGYAAGAAAAMAIDAEVAVRDVDVRALQDQLLEDRQALLYHAGLDHRAPDFVNQQRSRMVLETLSDVSVETVHAASIAHLVGRGVMGGYPDGTFRPGNAVTRGQLSTALARLLELPSRPGRSFLDTTGDPHGGNVEALYEAGFIDGYADGTFRPNQQLRRDQLASILARALQLTSEPHGPFRDVSGVHAGRINALYHAGIIGGTTSTTYSPAAITRRGQAATILARAGGAAG
jgi:hypothetical protein